MKKMTAILAVLFTLFTLRAESDFRFHHFNMEQGGLSFDDVKCVIQDSRSFIWCATRYGLNRFDGQRFKNFYRQDLGVDSDFIYCLYEDSDGRIWVGTGSGICFYDYDSDSFVNPAPEIHEKIFCIQADSCGNLWMGADNSRIFRYSRQDNKFQTYFLSGENAMVMKIALNGQGEICLAVYCSNIYKLNPEDGSIIPVLGDNDCFKDDDIGGMVFSTQSDQLLYLVGKRSGLCEVNVRTGAVRNLYSTSAREHFSSLRLDEEDNLWLASTSGLVRYDIQSGESECIDADKEDVFSLSDNNITSSYQDRQGNLWVCTGYGGLNCAAKNYSVFKTCYLPGCMIKGIVQTSDGNVWIASESMSLLEFNPSTRELSRPGQKYGLPALTAICVDADVLWLGSRSGVYRLNPKTGEKKHYPTLQGGDYRVLTLSKLSNGAVIAGTTGGLMRYDRATDSFEALPGSICANADAIVDDGLGGVWAATYSDGVYSFDIDSLKCREKYNSNGVPKAMASVTVGPGNEVWAMSFGSGFFRFDKASGQFIRYDRQSLPTLPSNVFYAALFDDRGKMWLATNGGIVFFDSQTGSVSCLSTENGLMDNVYTPYALKLASGEFLFCSKNGFTSFWPSEIFHPAGDISAAFSDLLLADRIVRPGKGSPITRNINEVDLIHLGAGHNSFSLEVATPGVLFSSCRLYYQLEGYDEAPRELTSSGRIDYFDVPHGTYTLKLGAESGTGEIYPAHKDVTITIDPPFWSSRTGILLLAAIALATIALIVFLILRRARVKENRRLEQFKKEREEELLQEKMSFLSNIIYEIKTPLTLIHTPLKSLLDKEDVPAGEKDELKVIESSSVMMNKLVSELQEFISIEESGYAINRQNTDIIDLLHYQCFNLAEEAKAKNIKLEFKTEEDSMTVAADSKALNKVFTNLLQNAMRFASSVISVKVSQKDKMVYVSIANDGPVIPVEKRSDIFKPFVRLGDDRTLDSQSFGIGLPLSRSITEAHGGSLVLTDSDNTEFLLSLPSYVIPQSVFSDNEEHEEESEGRLTLLLVEDNQDLRQYLKNKLAEDYFVYDADSAEFALSLLDKHKIDIVITAIGLSGMSGVELCRKISMDFSTSHVPVIIISALCSEQMKIKCMEAGAAVYMEKPFTIDYLRVCVKGILDKRAVLKSVYRMSGDDTIDLSMFDIEERDASFLKNLEAAVTRHISDDLFSVKQLESELLMSHSALYKKTTCLLGVSPVIYIRKKRLNTASQLIRNHDVLVSEVCYSVGFTSPSYFSKCFKEQFGVTPTEYARNCSEANI